MKAELIVKNGPGEYAEESSCVFEFKLEDVKAQYRFIDDTYDLLNILIDGQIFSVTYEEDLASEISEYLNSK